MKNRLPFYRLLPALLTLFAGCSKETPDPVLPAAMTLSMQEIVLGPGDSQPIRITVSPSDATVSAADFSLADAQTGKAPRYVTLEAGSTPGDGTIEVRLKDNNTSKKYTEELKIRCDKAGIASEVLTIRSQPYIPVVSITCNTDPIVSKDIWVPATLQIDGGNGFSDLEQTIIEIKGRGNSTWGWEKKPYALKLSSKKEVCGMPKHKRWCLIANYMDRTHLRNRAAYYIGSHSNLAWTPRNEYAEFYFNNKYQGLYLLTEQIKEDSKRVNITEMTTSDNSGEAVTGGYLLEMDTNYDEDKKFRSASTNIPVNIKYPDPEELTTEQFDYIRDYVNKVDALVSGNSQGNPFDYLDRTSFIDFWIIFELMANHEILHPKSIYFYKDRGGKLTAGPVWDFDYETLVSHTQAKWISYNPTVGSGEFPWYRNNWWNLLLKRDATLRTDVQKRWQEWYPFLATIPQFIDQEYKVLVQAEARNLKRWPDIKTGNINGDETLGFSAAVEKLKTVYTSRLQWMNGEIAKW